MDTRERAQLQVTEGERLWKEDGEPRGLRGISLRNDYVDAIHYIVPLCDGSDPPEDAGRYQPLVDKLRDRVRVSGRRWGIDFKKLLARMQADRHKPKFFWVYKCDACLEEKKYVGEMPRYLLSHWIDSMRYPRCRGMQHLVRIMPEDETLARCPACHRAGRSDPAKGPGWIDAACATCTGLGAVKKESTE